MRQAIIGLSLIGSFTIFALTTQLFERAVMFLLFGITPANTSPVDADSMLFVYVGLGITVIGYVIFAATLSTIRTLRAIFPETKELTLYLVGKWQDSLGPQLKLLKQEPFIIRLTRRKSLQ